MIRRLAEKLWSASRARATDRTYRSPKVEDQRVKDTHSQSHGKRTSIFLRRADRDRPQAAKASDSWCTSVLSSRRGWSEQFSRSRTDWPSTSTFRMTQNQSAAAVLGGFCFIISSIPLFISLAEGSAFGSLPSNCSHRDRQPCLRDRPQNMSITGP
jgi:hypothetical protein